MKSYNYFMFALIAVSCNSKPEKAADASTTAPTTTTTAPATTAPAAIPATAAPAAIPAAPVATPQTASVSADCQRKGAVIAKFEQNNAVFERLQNDKKTQEWLKITTKDGSCKIIDNLGDANHESVRFEDWDKDGLKDRINDSKWSYQVALFNPKTNDFSSPIEGDFSGAQSDYDKARGLKSQFMENKIGGTYELYKISNLKKVVYSEIRVEEHDEKTDITVMNSKGTVIKTDPSLVAAAKQDGTKLKAAIEAYWRKNEAVFSLK
jgi:hypothetical protein